MANIHLPVPASGTDRWLACPGSIEACKTSAYEHKAEYTEEGNLAHDAAEKCIRDNLATGNTAPWKVPKFSDNEELVEAAQKYVEQVFILCIGYRLDFKWVEQLFAHADYPDFGGSSDFACVYTIDKKVWLHVVDFKAGVGMAVDVVDNSQLKSYCAVIESNLPVKIDAYKLTIVQPRSYRGEVVKHWIVTPDVIESHMQGCIEAFGKTHLSTGSHCRWCPVVSTCELMSEKIHAVADLDIWKEDMHELTIPKWLELHDLAPAIKVTLDIIEQRLLDAAKKGEVLPDHKVVETRSHRHWTAEEKVIVRELKRLGIHKSLLYSDPKLRSPAQIEKIDSILSKKEISEAIKPLVAQTTTGRKVVLASADGRPVDFGQEFPEYTENETNE